MRSVLLALLLTFSISINCSFFTTPNCPALVDTRYNCNFYSECLEEKFQCGPTGYPIGYGGKYCSKFVAHLDKFPQEAQVWIDKTLICLKKFLVPTFNEGVSTCRQVYNIAFNSHPKCYVDSGFCGLFPNPLIRIPTIIALLGVFEIKDMSNLSAFKQILQTAMMCGGETLKWIMEAIKHIFGGK